VTGDFEQGLGSGDFGQISSNSAQIHEFILIIGTHLGNIKRQWAESGTSRRAADLFGHVSCIVAGESIASLTRITALVEA